jgi:hypothetical protein
MNFEIKPVRHEDLDRIYPESEDAQIGKLTYRMRDWPQDMHRMRWAIDEGGGAFLLRLPLTKEDSSQKYLFRIDGGVVVLGNVGYCKFSYLYVSDRLMDRLDEVSKSIREAFRVSGMMIEKESAETGLDAVSYAEFVTIDQQKA